MLIKKNEGRIWIRVGIGLMIAIWLASTLPLNTVSAASGTTYTTDFPLTENPLSEGGKWIDGKTTGIEWGNVQTGQSNAYGVNLSSQYGDPTAVLFGTWGPDQTVQATVMVSGVPQTCCHEVELRLRTTIQAYSITGYEINCSVSGQGYMQIVRWNGPLASFTLIGGGAGCKNGDVLKATMIGNTITVYKNGAKAASATDNNAFTGGSPGIGFYDNSDSNWSSFGFANFTASDTTNAPLAISTTSLPGAVAGTAYSAAITASGGTAPYTFSGTSSAPGLTLNDTGDTGTLSGTPTTSGTFSVSVAVRDSLGATAATTIPLLVTMQSPTATLSESCTMSRGNVVCSFTPANMPSGTVIMTTGSGGGASVTMSTTLP